MCCDSWGRKESDMTEQMNSNKTLTVSSLLPTSASQHTHTHKIMHWHTYMCAHTPSCRIKCMYVSSVQFSHSVVANSL